MLFAKGFACSEDALEGEKGFVDVYSRGADLNLAVDGLGRHFELLSNTYKPYPCGIVTAPFRAVTEVSLGRGASRYRAARATRPGYPATGVRPALGLADAASDERAVGRPSETRPSAAQAPVWDRAIDQRRRMTPNPGRRRHLLSY
jgi:hypothetical protein